MRVSDYIIERIFQNGTNYIFQVTGRGSLFLNDAVAKNNNINAISMHHEQSCSFAAVGYAQQSGELGACLISTGCASTNAITGLLCAWQDNIPCIFISGQNILKETTNYTGAKIRTYGQQEADIISIVKPITKYARMIKSSLEVVDILEEALFEAQNDRHGPVWLDIPLDIQSSQLKEEFIIPKFQANPIKNTLSDKDLNFIKEQIYTASRPVILIGSGLRSAKAEKELSKFIEQNNIPLTYTSSASDIYGFNNDLSIGSVGSMGCSRSGNFAVQNSDLLIVLGSRLTSLTTGSDYCSFAREAKIIVFDIDPSEHMKDTIKIDRFIKADVFDTLKKLNALNLSRKSSEWSDKCKHWKQLFNHVEKSFESKNEVDLYQLSKTLTEVLPNESSLVTDSGLIEVIIPNNVAFSHGMRCIHPNSQGSMGFAIPASIGTYLASKKPVFVVVGDGSIMMNIQELEVIKYQNLPIKIIIINNNVYSIIRRRQRDLFRKRTIGTDSSNGISCPQFSKVAECFGLNYINIEKQSNLKKGLLELINLEGPTICEIKGNEMQNYIEVSVAKSSITNRLVRRPLEDQSPFLARDLFLKEMIIDPIQQ